MIEKLKQDRNELEASLYHACIYCFTLPCDAGLFSETDETKTVFIENNENGCMIYADSDDDLIKFLTDNSAQYLIPNIQFPPSCQ